MEQYLRITLKNVSIFEFERKQLLLSHGKWDGPKPPESIQPNESITFAMKGERYLQGFVIYGAPQFGEEHLTSISWRYQGEVEPGTLVTASPDNFEVIPAYTKLQQPAASVKMEMIWLEK